MRVLWLLRLKNHISYCYVRISLLKRLRGRWIAVQLFSAGAAEMGCGDKFLFFGWSLINFEIRRAIQIFKDAKIHVDLGYLIVFFLHNLLWIPFRKCNINRLVFPIWMPGNWLLVQKRDPCAVVLRVLSGSASSWKRAMYLQMEMLNLQDIILPILILWLNQAARFCSPFYMLAQAEWTREGATWTMLSVLYEAYQVTFGSRCFLY